MLLLQADAVNGVCEVASFDAGIEPIDVKEFKWLLGYLGYNFGVIATALCDEETIAELDKTYGIKRLTV
jgi:ABC-type lipopolysaccharide export system ATPase subunit